MSDGWNYKASCDATAFLLSRLYTLGEAHWRVSEETPGKVFVKIMGGEKGGSWYVEVAFQGCVSDSVVTSSLSLYTCLVSCADKLKTDTTLPDGFDEVWTRRRDEARALKAAGKRGRAGAP